MTLSVSRALFVSEYLKDGDGLAAMARAGYSPDDGNVSRLLNRDDVKAEIARRLAARLAKHEVIAEKVLARYATIAFADPRKLIEYRRTCCRHCHGFEHEYQRTDREMRKARADWNALPEKDRKTIRFDELGGTGYDRRAPPAEDCPECFGQGVEQVYVHDTRTYDDEAAALYNGVKTTAHGLEIQMANRDGALEKIAKHLGMFVDKVEHSASGDFAILLRAACERLQKLRDAERIE